MSRASRLAAIRAEARRRSDALKRGDARAVEASNRRLEQLRRQSDRTDLREARERGDREAVSRARRRIALEEQRRNPFATPAQVDVAPPAEVNVAPPPEVNVAPPPTATQPTPEPAPAPPQSPHVVTEAQRIAEGQALQARIAEQNRQARIAANQRAAAAAQRRATQQRDGGPTLDDLAFPQLSPEQQAAVFAATGTSGPPMPGGTGRASRIRAAAKRLEDQGELLAAADLYDAAERLEARGAGLDTGSVAEAQRQRREISAATEAQARVARELSAYRTESGRYDLPAALMAGVTPERLREVGFRPSDVERAHGIALARRTLEGAGAARTEGNAFLVDPAAALAAGVRTSTLRAAGISQDAITEGREALRRAQEQAARILDGQRAEDTREAPRDGQTLIRAAQQGRGTPEERERALQALRTAIAQQSAQQRDEVAARARTAASTAATRAAERLAERLDIPEPPTDTLQSVIRSAQFGGPAAERETTLGSVRARAARSSAQQRQATRMAIERALGAVERFAERVPVETQPVHADTLQATLRAAQLGRDPGDSLEVLRARAAEESAAQRQATIAALRTALESIPRARVPAPSRQSLQSVIRGTQTNALTPEERAAELVAVRDAIEAGRAPALPPAVRAELDRRIERSQERLGDIFERLEGSIGARRPQPVPLEQRAVDMQTLIRAAQTGQGTPEQRAEILERIQEEARRASEEARGRMRGEAILSSAQEAALRAAGATAAEREALASTLAIGGLGTAASAASAASRFPLTPGQVRVATLLALAVMAAYTAAETGRELAALRQRAREVGETLPPAQRSTPAEMIASLPPATFSPAVTTGAQLPSLQRGGAPTRLPALEGIPVVEQLPTRTETPRSGPRTDTPALEPPRVDAPPVLQAVQVEDRDPQVQEDVDRALRGVNDEYRRRVAEVLQGVNREIQRGAAERIAAGARSAEDDAELRRLILEEARRIFVATPQLQPQPGVDLRPGLAVILARAARTEANAADRARLTRAANALRSQAAEASRVVSLEGAAPIRAAATRTRPSTGVRTATQTATQTATAARTATQPATPATTAAASRTADRTLTRITTGTPPGPPAPPRLQLAGGGIIDTGGLWPRILAIRQGTHERQLDMETGLRRDVLLARPHRGPVTARVLEWTDRKPERQRWDNGIVDVGLRVEPDRMVISWIADPRNTFTERRMVRRRAPNRGRF